MIVPGTKSLVFSNHPLRIGIISVDKFNLRVLYSLTVFIKKARGPKWLYFPIFCCFFPDAMSSNQGCLITMVKVICRDFCLWMQLLIRNKFSKIVHHDSSLPPVMTDTDQQHHINHKFRHPMTLKITFWTSILPQHPPRRPIFFPLLPFCSLVIHWTSIEIIVLSINTTSDLTFKGYIWPKLTS